MKKEIICLRKFKGITLISLIITVILMLILASVSISILTSDGGLFKKISTATNIYENAIYNEEEMLKDILNNEYFLPKTDGSWNYELGVNSPDTSSLPHETTKYITWAENNATYTEIVSDKQIKNWYNYSNGQWANIKTTSADKTLEAYWVWVPRFAYKLPESEVAKEIDVIFVKNNSKTGILADGSEVNCYYATDPKITANSTGLYVDATELAKGTDIQNEQAYIIHPAFTFGDTQLNGIWVAKYEASNNLEKIEVKANSVPWDNISVSEIFRVSREIQNTNGVLGTSSDNSKADSHMIKNVEWGAVAVLSQSKYGIFNPFSSTGTNGDKTYQIWNNPNFTTGTVASNSIENGQDAANIDINSCDNYNIGNGPKASTTGTVYGIYDMAGGAFEFVALAIEGDENNKFGTSDTKYFDLCNTTGEANTAVLSSKIGDLILEVKSLNSNRGWNNDFLSFVYNSNQFLHRGGGEVNGDDAGIFKSNFSYNAPAAGHSFRPVWIDLNI